MPPKGDVRACRYVVLTFDGVVQTAQHADCPELRKSPRARQGEPLWIGQHTGADNDETEKNGRREEERRKD